MTTENGTVLELGDIQAGALMPRPNPYAGTYLAVRIDDRHAGREVLRRLIPLLDPAASFDPARPDVPERGQLGDHPVDEALPRFRGDCRCHGFSPYKPYGST